MYDKNKQELVIFLMVFAMLQYYVIYSIFWKIYIFNWKIII